VGRGYICGSNPDISMARSHLVPLLQQSEIVMADAGYRGDSHFKCPFPRPLTDKARKFNSQHKDFMSRHETINKSIKQFQCMRDWRHGDSEHKRCFAAVINITQLCIEEQSLFAVVDSFSINHA